MKNFTYFSELNNIGYLFYLNEFTEKINIDVTSIFISNTN